MTVNELKTIVRCFERWLDTPEAAAIIQGGVPEVAPKVLAHTTRHAVSQPAGPPPVPAPVELSPPRQARDFTPRPVDLTTETPGAPTGFASLLSGARTTAAPTKASGVEDFMAMVNGAYRRVRYLSRSGGIVRVQVIKDGGEVSLTILSSVEQVHPEDRDRVAHIFAA